MDICVHAICGFVQEALSLAQDATTLLQLVHNAVRVYRNASTHLCLFLLGYIVVQFHLPFPTITDKHGLRPFPRGTSSPLATVRTL
jgi:hypothetical protein